MDIGKHYDQCGSPVLLTLVLLIIIPSSTGYIDCRISCRRCHENTEHPAVLEVYCAMCEECKQRRRERMLGRTTKGKGKVKPTLKSLVRMRDGVDASTDSEALIIRPQEGLQQAEQDSQQQYQGQPQPQLEPAQPAQEPPEPQQPQLTHASQKALRGMVYQAGCPTPPICSDSEEEPEQPLMNTETYTSRTTTTTTTTTTQAPPCPPVQTCRKKKKNIQHPCINPCMVPPAICPCPMYPPPPLQIPGYPLPPPQIPGYLQPPPEGPGYMTLPPQRPGYLPPPPQGPGYLQPPPQGPGYLQPPPQGPKYQQPNPPGSNPHWSVMQPPNPHGTNQPYDQQTQTTGIVVFENQRNPVTQPQGMVFPQTNQNQPSTMNVDFHYVLIGLPKNTL